ncbi:ATP-binding cassette domain-containing protein [Halalkalibacterium halodurans]|uniref:ATP-binding cassette domain-containing protein n=1 Tax=Halalkalibacterium halodurans TaxID=86665 RepID=UPI00399C4BDF
MTWGCHHLIKKVDASFSLGPISFTLEPGTVTALVGDNGSGKSTFFPCGWILSKPIKERGSGRKVGRRIQLMSRNS